MSVIFAILALMVMIILHEWGHFIAGRICKTPIHEFSVGMGPLIFQKKGKKETKFSLRLIPIGGYCAFDANDSTGVVDSSLNKLPVYKRIFIFIAGPLMNVLTAVFVYFSVAMFIGFPTAVPIIASVAEGSASYGILQKGDEIIAIDGKEINGSSTLLSTYVTEAAQNGGGLFTFIRDGEELSAKITPIYDSATERYLIGITQQSTYTKISFIESVKYSLVATKEAVVNTYEGLLGLITGKYKMNDMSGVVGVVTIVSEFATPSMFSMFLTVCALISVNLGMMNLLPIPGLDGSKIIFGIYEMIFKKPIPEKIEYNMTLIGFSLLIILFIVITFNDIMKLF